MVTLPKDAMCRVVLERPLGVTEWSDIFHWLDERGLGTSTNRQYLNGKLVALVFDHVQDAVMFKLTFGGTI